MRVIRELADEVIVDIGAHFRAVIRRGVVFGCHLYGLAVHADFLDFNAHFRIEHRAVKHLDCSKINALTLIAARRIAGNLLLCALGADIDADGIIAVSADVCSACAVAEQVVCRTEIFDIPLAVGDAEHGISGGSCNALFQLDRLRFSSRCVLCSRRILSRACFGSGFPVICSRCVLLVFFAARGTCSEHHNRCGQSGKQLLCHIALPLSG